MERFLAGGSLEEALDWLCMMVPNAELPGGLRGTRGRSIRVVTQPNTAAFNTEEGRLLSSLGFSQPDVAAVLKDYSQDSQLAAVACWAKLLGVLAGVPCPSGGIPVAQLTACLHEASVSMTEPSWAEPGDEDEEMAVWWNEQFSFISVYPELVVHASEHCCRVAVPVPEALAMVYNSGDQNKDSSAELVVVFWQGCGDQLPLIGLQCKAMPAAVRLHFTQAVFQHLKEEYSSIQGVLHASFTVLSEALSGTAPSLTEARLRWGALLQGEHTNGSAASVVEQAPSRQQKSVFKGPRRSNARLLTPEQLEKESARLKREFQQTMEGAQGCKMRAARDRLPAAAKKSLVLDAVSGHRVVVISGATGCGKSTQVRPSILPACEPSTCRHPIDAAYSL